MQHAIEETAMGMLSHLRAEAAEALSQLKSDNCRDIYDAQRIISRYNTIKTGMRREIQRRAYDEFPNMMELLGK